MRNKGAFLFLLCLTVTYAQQGQPAVAVPQLVRVSNTFHPANGLPAAPVESVTFSIYSSEHDGTPLWQETQNVSIDADGRYNAVLGATLNEGLPADLFRSGEPRWLGVQFNRPGETEQPRAQLVSVPYALKASDAETLGGRPASAYLLDPNASATGGTNTSGANITAGPATLPNSKSLKPRSISGTMNYIPYFTDGSNDLGNSVLYQNGSNIGVGTTTAASQLEIVSQTSVPTRGLTSTQYTSDASAVVEIFRKARGSLSSPSVVSNGDYIGASNYEAYDGSQFVSGVAGFGARVNGTVATGSVPTDLFFFTSGGAVDNNPYKNNHVRMVVSSSGDVGIGTITPGYQLDVAGDINFSGILRNQGIPVQQFSSTLNNTASGISALSNAGLTGTENTAIGNYALTGNTAGSSNTGLGYFALKSNTGGNENTAVGAQSLENTVGTSNGSAGSGNTAIGWGALQNNTTGNSNIAIGLGAGSDITTGSNNIDIGHTGVSGDSGAIRIGTSQTSFYAAGVSNVNLTNDSNSLIVLIDATTGQLGVASSGAGPSSVLRNEVQRQGKVITDQEARIHALEEKLAKLEAAISASSR